MALMDVYYEHYWKEREEFRRFLEQKGFRCVDWNQDYPGVLVNLHMRRFALIYRACKHLCVGDRNYTREEFLEKVFRPWEEETAGGTRVRQRDPDILAENVRQMRRYLRIIGVKD